MPFSRKRSTLLLITFVVALLLTLDAWYVQRHSGTGAISLIALALAVLGAATVRSPLVFLALAGPLLMLAILEMTGYEGVGEFADLPLLSPLAVVELVFDFMLLLIGIGVGTLIAAGQRLVL